MRWAASALVGAAVVAAHAGPAATVVAPLRRRIGPGGDDDAVALTFDDGPDPASTPYFLDALDELEVRATFFLLGVMAERAPSLAADIAGRGHEIALHGYDHRNLLFRNPKQAMTDVARGRDAVSAASGVAPVFWRPPYGVMTGPALLAARRLGLRPALWTGWGRDWTADATPASVLACLEPEIKAGARLLLHDSDCTSAPGAWRAALGALPELIARCRERGLRIAPLREHQLR
jgi:peptidoglycan/xylan/chitin deacetylase (PgdA/CDA1 family)